MKSIIFSLLLLSSSIFNAYGNFNYYPGGSYMNSYSVTADHWGNVYVNGPNGYHGHGHTDSHGNGYYSDYYC